MKNKNKNSIFVLVLGFVAIAFLFSLTKVDKAQAIYKSPDIAVSSFTYNFNSWVTYDVPTGPEGIPDPYSIDPRKIVNSHTPLTIKRSWSPSNGGVENDSSLMPRSNPSSWYDTYNNIIWPAEAWSPVKNGTKTNTVVRTNSVNTSTETVGSFSLTNKLWNHIGMWKYQNAGYGKYTVSKSMVTSVEPNYAKILNQREVQNTRVQLRFNGDPNKWYKVTLSVDGVADPIFEDIQSWEVGGLTDLNEADFTLGGKYRDYTGGFTFNGQGGSAVDVTPVALKKANYLYDVFVVKYQEIPNPIPTPYPTYLPRAAADQSVQTGSLWDAIQKVLSNMF